MILSRNDINQIADTIIRDFQGDTRSQFPKTDIDQLAEIYLQLSVRYLPLSQDKAFWVLPPMRKPSCSFSWRITQMKFW